MPRADALRDALGEDYTTRHAREKGTVRAVLNDGLVEFTGGNARARMRYTVNAFCSEVFLAYGAKLVGWPPRVPFVNLSSTSITTAHVGALLTALATGRMKWQAITLGERLAALEDPRNACPGPRFQDAIRRAGRNDIGARRERPTADPVKYPPRYSREGAKSARWYDSDDEDDGQQARHAPGLPGTSRSEGLEEVEDADEWAHPRGGRVVRGELPEDPIDSFSDDDE